VQWLQQHFSSDEMRSGWKIEYAVIAIVNTIDFLGYVHQTPNRMVF